MAVVVDAVGGAHLAVLPLAADEHANPQPAAEPLVAVDDGRHAPRLVGGEGVHGIEQDGLDALFAAVQGAEGVIEDGIEKALGLAGAGACGDDGGLGLVAVAGGEALPGEELVQIGPVGGPHVEGDGLVLRGEGERQSEAHPGALEHAALAGEEREEGAFHVAIGELPRAAEVVEEGLADLARDEVGNHARAAFRGEGALVAFRPGSPPTRDVSSMDAMERNPACGESGSVSFRAPSYA